MNHKRRKSPKAASKTKSRGTPRKLSQKCECLHCSRYHAKFKPAVHPCPNFKKKMTGTQKPRKIVAPKKVITSRWVVPPKFDSQRTFPPCRCLPSSSQELQVSRERSEDRGSPSSSATSLERVESETANRGDKKRNLREEFYDALEKQAEQTSEPSVGRSRQKSYPRTRTEHYKRGYLTKRVTRAPIRREVQEVGRAWMSPGRVELDRQDDLSKNLPRSVSQGLVISDTSFGSAASGAKAARSMSPESRSGRRTNKAASLSSPSTSKESLTGRKLARKAVKPTNTNLNRSSSTVSFTLTNTDPISHREESAARVSLISQTSSKSRGVLKDPRSTPVRSNSARLFLEEEHLRRLQEAGEKSLSPDSAAIEVSTSSNPQQSARACTHVISGAADSSVTSEDPTSNARLAPSRQFMNICAQELAKRKLIARAQATQQPDTTDLFGMESHYEVFAIEKKVNGCTWGIRAYRPV